VDVSDCAGVCLTACLLLTAELIYPKSSISLRPSGGVALGGAVTVQCRGRHQNARFLLCKDGNPIALRDVELAGDVAEGTVLQGARLSSWRGWGSPGSPIPGSYPKPSISVSPSGLIPVGGKVTIQCWHQRLGMRFLFYKAGDGNYLTYTDPAGSKAEFPIISARRDHGGSYTCRYHDKSGIYSEPSDPVQIIVAGEGPSPAPRLPAPHPARPQGVSMSPGTQWMGHPASLG
uniref:Ig-like domain-containing protein n=1 Tax=Gopherus evgoodei TaxID=1825980 RepID=A0A8C4W2Z1_9SAUR